MEHVTSLHRSAMLQTWRGQTNSGKNDRMLQKLKRDWRRGESQPCKCIFLIWERRQRWPFLSWCWFSTRPGFNKRNARIIITAGEWWWVSRARSKKELKNLFLPLLLLVISIDNLMGVGLHTYNTLHSCVERRKDIENAYSTTSYYRCANARLEGGTITGLSGEK